MKTNEISTNIDIHAETSSSIIHFWVCCLGLLHESQDEFILAERAFLEAKKQLKADEAKKQTQREEERKDREKNNKNEKDQQDNEETDKPACPSPTVNQGRQSRKTCIKKDRRTVDSLRFFNWWGLAKQQAEMAFGVPN